MKHRNLYKDIVICAVIIFLITLGVNLCKTYLREQRSYGFTIQSETELTEAVAAEIKNISGICRFEPASFAMVTIKLEEYTLETKMMGIDLEAYPLDWKETEGNVILGNTSALFFGIDAFGMFSDKNGHSPGKREIKSWMEQYHNLPVTITDESGHTKKGRIFGILKSPGTMVCMEKSQMEEIFGEFCQVTGGYMEIYGYQNMKKAKDVLERGGFVVE